MDIFDQITEILALKGMTQTRMANEVGVSQGTVARWAAKKSSPEGEHRDAIRDLHKRLLVHGVEAPAPNASSPPRFERFPDGSIPLLGQAVGGPNGRFLLNGQAIGRLFCPPMLEGVEGAYGLRVYGTSMEPRFRAGETVWINPREPVRAGDDVVAQILSDDGDGYASYIKEFKSLSGYVLRLWQLNPDHGEENELRFDADKVFSVHKVVFHAT